ncbi:hypothetical protein H696_04825 [Fonticula alba]|uniref:Uncharacterized protein n=1 Tax=Fonticula alba TaxID=691883 RepID=A0A058Z3Q8_FONAL|nr:hypothetical protein H696_04825 [Fonticula alba]KCV68533.1 hypothetical protein H696_04825 [Fonticula alba]|eukprot:XP_009496965.1 hypothetical protein H696_04825 [Fonticula alba]
MSPSVDSPLFEIVGGVDDLHVHLRTPPFNTEILARLARAGGAGRVLVMPNLERPVTGASRATAYRRAINRAEPRLDALMTLYFTEGLTPADVETAAREGVTAIKLYPAGATMNSAYGVSLSRLATMAPVLAAMEKHGLILCIHGEIPPGEAVPVRTGWETASELATAGNAATATSSDPFDAALLKELIEAEPVVACSLTGEAYFLPILLQLTREFPRLKIVLEHVTTAAAVMTVARCGPNVAATITVHHIDMIADDWAGRGHLFCKPVAKTARDRAALRQVIRMGHPRFFLGSDSAPHSLPAKLPPNGGSAITLEQATRAPESLPSGQSPVACCPGVFTSPLLVAYLATSLERFGALDRLADFAGRFGREFYGLAAAAPPGGEPGVLRIFRRPQVVPEHYDLPGGPVVPYLAGVTLPFSVEWANTAEPTECPVLAAGEAHPDALDEAGVPWV